jgi:hypothetical protein
MLNIVAIEVCQKTVVRCRLHLVMTFHMYGFVLTLHILFMVTVMYIEDRLCGLVVRLPGCRGHGFDSRRYHIF